ncbi:MAG TPA: LLM class flavin-dependent oxidoreductase [Actinocrinis sp.]|jgi:alkanesulfonate monooxygenase SsuD/methylene tetrahydromethanopterin reductase-like flavin-dependent oxidoreductase (luciferase family)
MEFGLSISNRAVVLGRQSTPQVLGLVRQAEASGAFDSVWVGDSLLVNPRLESLTLLSALAAVTERVLLGTACMGSFALRNPVLLAHQWASLDHIANGRTRLIVCSGGGAGPLWEAEAAVFGVLPSQRRARILEHMQILRRLWSEDHVSHHGELVQFDDVTVEPKPLQRHCPIWLATNATRLSSGAVAGAGHALTRVGTYADGWMTHSVPPEAFARSWQAILDAAQAAGRDASQFDNCLYHNVNVSSDYDSALDEANEYLGELYGTTFTPERARAWCTLGDPKSCIEDLRRYNGSGVRRITLRLCSHDQAGQLKRLVNEVLPYV